VGDWYPRRRRNRGPYGSLFGEVYENEPSPGDPRLAIQQVDFANAFNTVGRSAIFDGLHEYAPSLQGFFRWSYGGASPIYSADAPFSA